MTNRGKIIIVSAPSGCGKSTIINAINDRRHVDLKFSVSATNRAPRPGEIDGVNYHFLTDEQFRDHIAAGDFVEYEEVYPGRFYGTLKSEIDNRLASGEDIVLDIDVKGGVNVKRLYPDNSLSIFIKPPSIETLRQRLVMRGTESEDTLAQRLGRAEYELSFIPRFDIAVTNDSLADAIVATEDAILSFLGQDQSNG